MPKQRITGVVTSDKMDKTIVITQTTRETHPLYGKKFTKNRKFVAHDEKSEAHVGDTVEIIETTPISKTVRFTLNKIIERGHEAVEVKTTEVEKDMEAKVEARKERAAAKKEAEKEKVVDSPIKSANDKADDAAKEDK
jgi:small subunit ribosomal protein S17